MLPGKTFSWDGTFHFPLFTIAPKYKYSQWLLKGFFDIATGSLVWFCRAKRYFLVVGEKNQRGKQNESSKSIASKIYKLTCVVEIAAVRYLHKTIKCISMLYHIVSSDSGRSCVEISNGFMFPSCFRVIGFSFYLCTCVRKRRNECMHSLYIASKGCMFYCHYYMYVYTARHFPLSHPSRAFRLSILLQTFMYVMLSCMYTW